MTLRLSCGVFRASSKALRQVAASRHEKAKCREHDAEDDQQSQQAELERMMIVDKPVVHDAIQDGPRRIEIR
jgi:hypothetical protein